MKRITPIIVLAILGIIAPLSASISKNLQLQLHLEKGDYLVYESFTKQLRNINANQRGSYKDQVEILTRLQLTVKEIPEPGTYIFSYKKLFTRSCTTSENETSCSDTRFPVYGEHLNAIILYYLSTIDFEVLLDTKDRTMQVLNIDHIRAGLLEYIESRGINMDQYTRIECEYFTDEANILQDISFLNFYPPGDGMQEWTNIQVRANLEEFKITAVTDSSIVLQSDIPNYISSIDRDGVKHKGRRLPRINIVDPATGILLQSASPPKNSSNYKFSLDLITYSKWQKPTYMSGQLKHPEIKQICLESPEVIVGSDVRHQIITLDQDGTFTVPLEITHPIRYRMYLVQKFPVSSNTYLNLYIEPGDSVYIHIDTTYVKNSRFSGRGYRNSELFNKLDHMQIPLSYSAIYYPIIRRDKSYFSFLDRIRSSLTNNENKLEAEIDMLSPGFIQYILSEIECISRILDITDAWREYGRKYNFGESIEPTVLHTFMPYTPQYSELRNLEFYAEYISLYSKYQYQSFAWNNNRGNPRLDLNNKFVFSSILLNGFPLYSDLVIQLENLATMPLGDRISYEHFFKDFLSSCNNSEVKNYVERLYHQFESLLPGNVMPGIELLDLNGIEWDWEKTKGKIVVLMLFKDYNSAHILCEDLYKKYGYNKEDVIILRISPGIGFQQWKDFNSSYSSGMHQMYFPGGEDAFMDQFGLTFTNTSKILIIGRDGKIFSYSALSHIRTDIKTAIAQPPPPRTPFMETAFARIFFGALIGMIISFSLYRIIIYRRLKKKAMIQKMTELEQKALKAQLNPHFLFNCLNSIQHLIRSNKRKEADNYLTTFAVLIRQMLSNSDKESVSVSEELESLKLYLELEQMRFDFEYEIDIDEQIDIFNTMIPTMLLQPVVENAILHGLDPKKGSKKLRINAAVLNNSIQFTVDDNGVGREVSSHVHSGHESKGLDIIEGRIALLNKTDPGSYTLEIIDKNDQEGKSQGTSVIIVVPDEK